MIAQRLYTLAWTLALPLVALRLLWRARRQPEYRLHWRERLGIYPCPGTPGAIWIHAVSVGETRAAAPLVRALLDQAAHHRVLLTQMTPTGRATATALWADEPRVAVAYLPYDLPGAVARFLRHFRPAVGLMMETEVWPNMLAGAEQAGVPMVLANARLSARSARGYARLGRLGQAAFGRFARIGAQTEADADRLRNAGGQDVSVTGNIKYEIAPPETAAALAAGFRAWIGPRPVLLAASTREGEEAPLLDAFARLAPPEVLLALVPRHPQRFDEVAALAARRSLALARRTQAIAVPPAARVWLGDSMGELFGYYGAADVAIIGGAWAPLGGQNPIEAAASGVPSLLGPHTFNFAQVCELAVEAGASLRCPDLEAAVREAITLLGDSPRRQQMAERGRHFVAAHRGALAATLALVQPFLPAAPTLPRQ